MALPLRFVDDTVAPQQELDRPATGRFPLERELRFRTTGKRSGVAGFGWTIEMTGKSLAFRTATPLQPGKRLVVAISWPAQLDNKCALKLVARGRIVSVDLENVAVSIEQYEFRIVGTNGLTV